MEASKKKAKSKAAHVRPTCWAPKFVSQFIVPATRHSCYYCFVGRTCSCDFVWRSTY